jgi:succinyl-diaminopimelate desuccinylase
MRAMLDEPGHGLNPGGAGQLLELRELAVGIDALREHGQDEPALGLRAQRGVGLSHRHLQVIMTPAVPTPDLAARTLQLVDVPSESRSEAGLVDLVRELVPGATRFDDGEVLLYGDGPVVLAGHLDTIPAQANIPGHIADGAVHGLGASDMKAGVAVMIELARAGVPGRYLFFTREEIPVSESPLPALFDTGLVDDAQLAVVLEPTDCILHAGCLGNIQARVTFHGQSAHSARPWTGVNAIHELVRGLQGLVDLEPRAVELDGLTFREVVSAVRVEGGIAANVVPARASVELNFRYAPDRTREDAEARLRELVPVGELEVLSNSPSAPPALTNPLALRLRELVPEVAPKQAWTPVAQFAERGIDAINYGPGATAYAHKQDEQVPVANLDRTFEVLRAFLGSV